MAVSSVSGGPGPGASNPRISRNGGGYIGYAPAHKIGTGVKIPHPATNLKKRGSASAARIHPCAWQSVNFSRAFGPPCVYPQSNIMGKVLTALIKDCSRPVRRRTRLEIDISAGRSSDRKGPLSRSDLHQGRAQLQSTAKRPVSHLGTTRSAGLQALPLLRRLLHEKRLCRLHKLERRARVTRRTQQRHKVTV